MVLGVVVGLESADRAVAVNIFGAVVDLMLLTEFKSTDEVVVDSVLIILGLILTDGFPL